MAKKNNKPNTTSNLLSQDFISDVQKQINSTPGGGLYGQLAKLGAQQAMAPVMKAAATQALFTPIVQMIDAAEQRIKDGMSEYIAANPNIDDSLLYEGTGDLVNSELKTNSARFKELQRQLAYGGKYITGDKYTEIADEINKIQSSNINLRNENKKLLGIRNLIKDSDVQEISAGNPASYQLMYDDILKGNKDNFSTIDGKLHWTNPNAKADDPLRTISIESVNASGPEMTDGAAFDQHYKIHNAVRQTPKELVDDQNLNYQINNMFKTIGDKGVKSLIFDSVNPAAVGYSKNGAMFNTAEWFDTYFRDVGIDPNSDAATNLREQIKIKGVLHTENGIRVKEHFQNWYANKLKSSSKYGKGLGKTDNDFPEDPDETEETIINYGSSGNEPIETVDESPFSKLTTQGATFGQGPNARIDNSSLLLSYGDDDYVENRLNEEYGTVTYNNKKHNFSFKANKNFGGFGDSITVTHVGPDGKETSETFRHDHMNLRGNRASNKDINSSQMMRRFMEQMIGYQDKTQSIIDSFLKQ